MTHVALYQSSRYIILSNTSYQLLAKFTSVLLTFITTILLIRLGGPDLYGELTKALSLIAIGFTATDFGLNAVAVRAMRGGTKTQIQVLTDTVLARGLLSLLVTLGVNLLMFLLPGGYSFALKEVFWLGSLSIIFQGLYTSINAWFQRKLTYWKMSLSTVLGTLLGSLLSIYFVIFAPTLFNLLFATTLGYLVMSLSSLKLAGLHLSFRSSLNSALALLRHSLPLGLILFANVVSSKVDTIVLGVFRSSAELGQYGFAYRIFDVALVVPSFVMNSIYPLLLDAKSGSKRRLIRLSSIFLLTLGVMGGFTLWLLAPLITHIRGDLPLAILSLQLLALSLPLFYITSPIMWQLIEAGLEKKLLLVYVTAATVNASLNLFFVPLFGVVSSAVLTGLTELIILLGLLAVRRRHLPAH